MIIIKILVILLMNVIINKVHSILIAIKREFLTLDNTDDQIDYANDEILNILIQKRDELLRSFR
jgi:hypothetical protein